MKTSEAAEVLNVSPTTLRAWEVRHSFPTPARTIGQHRVYERGEILALRRALDEGLSVSSAIEKVRANLGIDDTQLKSALRAFDAESADAAMEATLAVRRLDASVEDVLLTATDELLARAGEDSAVWAFAARWAIDWLRRQARLGIGNPRAGRILIGDGTGGEADPDRVALAALEMCCARSGTRVLTLPLSGLGGVADAAAGIDAAVVAGRRCEEQQLVRWLGIVRAAAGPVPLLFYRSRPRPRGLLDHSPLAAHRTLLSVLEQRSAQAALPFGRPQVLAS